MTRKNHNVSFNQEKTADTHIFMKITKRPEMASTVALFLHLLINGYYFPFADNYLQLALSKKHQDPTLFPNDPGMSQNAYQSFFWEFMGRFVFWEKSWIIFFLVFLASLWLIYYLLWYIGKQVTEKDLGGVLLVFLFITPKYGVANVQVIDSWLSLRDITFPFLLLAFYLYLNNKKIWTYFILGLSFNLHPISSYNFAFLFLFTDTLRVIRKETTLMELLKRIGVYVVGSLPLVLMYVLRVASSDQQSMELLSAPSTWLQIMHYRSYFHVFPFEYYPIYYVLSLGYLAIYGLYFWFEKQMKVDVTRSEFYLELLAGMMILFLVNLVFSEFIPSFFVIQLQFGRVSRFLPFFAMVLVTIMTTETLTKYEDWSKWQIDEVLIISMYLSYVIFDNPVIPLILVFMVLMKNHGKIKPVHFPRVHDLSKLKRQLFVGSQILWILLLILLPIIFRSVFSFPILQGVHPKPERENPWIDVQYWAKENTNKTALFITPPQLAGFRVYSERPIVGEWKDGTLAFFNTSYASVWWERMQDLGFTKENLHSYGFTDYAQLNFTSIAMKYHASFVIYRVTDYFIYRTQLPFTIAYANTEFMVLMINN